MEPALSPTTHLRLGTVDGMDAVRALLSSLGRADGEFLHRVVLSLLDTAPDILRPSCALLLGQAFGSFGDQRMVRFAAALQCVVLATAVHRSWSIRPRVHDQLEVLAGDFLYAQAAMLTASVQDLQVMGALSSAIKQLCNQGLDENERYSLAPLFALAAEGTSSLLGIDDVRSSAVLDFGRALDLLARPGVLPVDVASARTMARRSAAQFARDEKLQRLLLLIDEVQPVPWAQMAADQAAPSAVGEA